MRFALLFGALLVTGACASRRVQSIDREPLKAAGNALPAQATQPTRAAETTTKRETAPTSSLPNDDKKQIGNDSDASCPAGMKL
ncbi:MAG TPA: hypothetical protein VHW01_29875, partial [Polyangiaceae bacterium]|nr:hypothetical protein [Polyangiaceae bacterium]